MKITSIPKGFRNAKRVTEIVTILSRYGLADWISRLQFDFFKGLFKTQKGDALSGYSTEARVRMALADLGPTFIKLGQILSTRADLVGVALADELKKLQSDVPADPTETVRKTVETELGQPLEEIFDNFDLEPLASASIGQVHQARLKDGAVVVVKVQHADITTRVREDLDIIGGLAQLATRVPEFAQYRPVETAAEFRRALLRELDFGREERNLQMFASELSENPNIRIPQVFNEYCTGRVLTMEMLEGIKISENEKLVASGLNPEAIAMQGAELYLEMIFDLGCYHADPHPGNILVLPGNVIGLLDFGMVGRLDERLRENIENMLLSIINRDARSLTMIICRIGSTPPGLDESALTSDVADFVMHYGNQPVEQLNLSTALNEMTEIIRRYGIMLPSQVAMLIKTLVMLEGTARSLSPTFSLIEAIKPLQRKVLMRRLSPRRYLYKAQRIWGEVEYLLETVPRRLMDILQQVQTGKFDVHLDHRRLGPSVNRLVLGMMTSALFLGSSLMLSMEVKPLLFPENSFLGFQKMSAFGLIGIGFSALLGIRIIRAIIKSGHLDRTE